MTDISGMGPSGMFADGIGSGVGGGQGFDFGSLMSNPMVLQMMATMGANLDPQGAGGALGNMALGNIKSKSYLEMMKKMLGGGKMTFDGEKGTYNFTGSSEKLGSALAEEEDQTLSRKYPSSFYKSTPGQFGNTNTTT